MVTVLCRDESWRRQQEMKIPVLILCSLERQGIASTLYSIF
jgi:hypothetical protein